MKIEQLENRLMFASVNDVLQELIAVRDNFGTTVEAGDINSDGSVDFRDFLLVANKLKTVQQIKVGTLPTYVYSIAVEGTEINLRQLTVRRRLLP